MHHGGGVPEGAGPSQEAEGGRLKTTGSVGLRSGTEGGLTPSAHIETRRSASVALASISRLRRPAVASTRTG